MADKGKLTAKQKRSVLRDILENTFGIQVYLGSPIEKFIAEEFKPGNKSPLNEALVEYTETKQARTLAESIVKSMKEYPNLAEVQEYLVDTFPAVYELFNYTTSVDLKKQIFQTIIKKAIKTLQGFGLTQKNYEIAKLLAIEDKLGTAIEINLVGSAISSLGKMIQQDYIEKIGNICKKIAPFALLLSNARAATSDKVDALFSCLYHIAEHIRIPNFKNITKSVQQASLLRYLNPIQDKCPNNLDQVLTQVGLKLGSHTLNDVRKQLREGGATEQEICNAIYILGTLPKKNKIITHTRRNQKVAAASTIVLNIAKEIKYEPLEKLAHIGISYSCMSQLYHEIKTGNTSVVSMGHATGMLLHSAGVISSNNNLMDVGSCVLAGVEAAKFASLIPGGAILAVPAGIITTAANFFLRRRNKGGLQNLHANKIILQQMEIINKNMMMINKVMQEQFSLVMLELNNLSRNLLASIQHGFENLEQIIRSEIKDINQELLFISGKIDRLGFKLNDKFKKMYENKILAQIRNYSLIKKMNISINQEQLTALLIKLVYWVQFESVQEDLINVINFSELPRHDKYAVLNDNLVHESALDNIALIGNFLDSEQLIALIDEFQLPNLTIWIEAVMIINDILKNYHELLPPELNKRFIITLINDMITGMKENLIKFSENEGLRSFILDKLQQAYQDVMNIIDKHAMENYINPLLSLERLIEYDLLKDSLKKKFSNVPAAANVFGHHSYNFHLDLSKVFAEHIFDALVSTPELLGKLHLLQASIDVNPNSHFFTGEYSNNNMELRNNEQLLKIFVNVKFYLDLGTATTQADNAVAYLNLQLYSGGIANRIDFYNRRYGSTPMQSAYCIILDHHRYKTALHPHAITEYGGSSTCPSLPGLATTLDKINAVMNKSLLDDTCTVSVSMTLDNTEDGHEELMKSKVMEQRYALIEKLANTELQQQLTEIMAYSRILNTMLDIAGYPSRIPCLSHELRHLLTSVPLDVSLTTDFAAIIDHLNPDKFALPEEEYVADEYCEVIQNLTTLTEDLQQLLPQEEQVTDLVVVGTTKRLAFR